MTDNLLDGGNDQVNIDENKNYLEELVGEGKKFRTVEELAKGKYMADAMVEVLKARQDELRKDYEELQKTHNTGLNLQELLDQLKQQNLQVDNTPGSNEVHTPQEFDISKIDELVSSKIEQQKRLDQEKANLNLVKEELKKRFGSNRDALNKHLESLDLTEDYVTSVAKQNPKFVLRALGISDSKNELFEAPPASERSTSFRPTTEKRTWSWYQKMKRDNPKLYRDPKTTIQMQKDALALGAAFRDGDYHSS